MSEVWSIYLLRCADGSLYTGIATDVERRFAQHCSGERGAKYLRGRGPLDLVWSQAVGDRSQASRLEYQVKRLPKPQKESLLATPALQQEMLRTVSGSDDNQ